jgi:hypothetical protein
MLAGELETSILLAAHPAYLRDGWQNSDHTASDRRYLTTLGMRAYTPSGVIGYPSRSQCREGSHGPKPSRPSRGKAHHPADASADLSYSRWTVWRSAPTGAGWPVRAAITRSSLRAVRDPHCRRPIQGAAVGVERRPVHRGITCSAMPTGVAAAVSETDLMTYQDFAGAEDVSVRAVRRRADHPGT